MIWTNQVSVFCNAYIIYSYTTIITLHFIENRLIFVEGELTRANLTGRIDKFRELRNQQKKWIDKYEKELSELDEEVQNVRLISEALPDNCYTRNRLEP